MKLSPYLIPLLLSFAAACGNALVTLGQKKAALFENPFLFGAISLLIASCSLFSIACFYPMKGLQFYITSNLKWFATAGLGLVLLNIFLYFLYRQYGASCYTLYSILAIITTSLFVSFFVFHEKINQYHIISFLLAGLTIYFFMKGKTYKQL